MLDRETLRRDLGSLSLPRREEGDPRRRMGRAGRLALLLLGLVVAGGVLFAGWRWFAGRAIEVRIGRASLEGARGPSAILSMGGYVAARTRATVGASIPGRLVELLVDEGDSVTKGQILARIESDALVAEKGEAEALLEKARLRRERMETLEARGVVSRSERDQAVTEHEAALKRVEQLQARIEYTIIRSPINGRVLRRDAEPGEIVSTGGFGLTKTAIVTLADPQDLEVEVDVNEMHLRQVRPGGPARILLDAWPEAPYKGRVDEIAPVANRQKSTVQVKVRVLDPDGRIRPEMSARVVLLDAEEGEAPAGPARILVPREALRQDAGGTFVYVVRDGTALRRAVRTGGELGDRVAVEEGLGGGEDLVLGGAEGLRDGTRVRAKGD